MVKEKRRRRWETKRVTEGDKSRISSFYCQMQGVSHSVPNHCNMSGEEGRRG